MPRPHEGHGFTALTGAFATYYTFEGALGVLLANKDIAVYGFGMAVALWVATYAVYRNTEWEKTIPGWHA